MSVYVVAQGRIEDRKMLDEYVAKALPTIQAHGGRLVGYDESPEVVEGRIDHPRTVLPLRLRSTPGTLIVVEGLADASS